MEGEKMGFQAYDVALEVVRGTRPLLDPLRAKDPELTDQVYRAMKSLGLNTGEGGRRIGKNRSYHFAIAAGSAQEIKMAFEIAEAFEFLTAAQTGSLLVLVDRLLAMLWRLTHPRPDP